MIAGRDDPLDVRECCRAAALLKVDSHAEPGGDRHVGVKAVDVDEMVDEMRLKPDEKPDMALLVEKRDAAAAGAMGVRGAKDESEDREEETDVWRDGPGIGWGSGRTGNKVKVFGV